ncbi:hypothetical protein BAUCODRAFT_35258 [Baudoinia panamericana UAMH 10762]|uniref:Uncharacterized protein n=1 Tax=Baudoinia panamericana (strain UAMH 10762) TaxID=717646 RepID=M2LLS9_BAUPA|nr:uncharacterized protein BAUCODRAFT_35258 [Baudoinia panamericana UAMH 10762]EMC95267.1 hypothetical protein BAUCODRAFT_35258 [Baudoinia panamericana UAMH 10762]
MLARAFTVRHKKSEMQIKVPGWLGRAASQRGSKPVPRAQISSPLALLSTSNPLFNNAQHIPGAYPIEDRSISSSSSTHSADDSDASSSHRTAGSMTDASSVDELSTPSTPVDVEPNHLSCYFKPAVDTKAVSPDQTPTMSQTSFDAPLIPRRVPSHSKKAHEKLHRKNSIKRLMSPPPRELRNSTDMFAVATLSAFVEAPREAPFGKELEQVDEVAEEFGQVSRDAETEADLNAVQDLGLGQFAACDYMSEIQSLVFSTFYEEEQAFTDWI